MRTLFLGLMVMFILMFPKPGGEGWVISTTRYFLSFQAGVSNTTPCSLVSDDVVSSQLSWLLAEAEHVVNTTNILADPNIDCDYI